MLSIRASRSSFVSGIIVLSSRAGPNGDDKRTSQAAFSRWPYESRYRIVPLRSRPRRSPRTAVDAVLRALARQRQTHPEDEHALHNQHASRAFFLLLNRRSTSLQGSLPPLFRLQSRDRNCRPGGKPEGLSIYNPKLGDS